MITNHQMNRQTFRERVTKSPLLMDGAMGTALHGKGVPLDHCFDAINCENPALVAEIHRSYIEAGADVIETNSFGANRFKLADYGLQNSVALFNETAVSIARRVIESSYKPVWLAGSVGPLGVRLAPLGRVSVEAAQAAFTEQIAVLVMAGVDLLILETMSDIKEVETAVAAARTLTPDLPIIAQMTFTRDDRTLLGYAPDVVARKLAALDVDAIGVNCSGGPAQVLRLLAVMHQIAPEKPLTASPNAGWPEQSEGGRLLYPATPVYFGEYARSFVAAGACLVGGCCGTTAVHIAAMRRALDQPAPLVHPLPPVQLITHTEKISAVMDPPTRLAQYLTEEKFVITVEMSPPRGIASQRLLEGARMLKEAGANLLNIADSPLARMHMSAWAAAYLVQKEVGLETVLHFPTRGRNLLRVQGDLLAAYAMGIRNLFVVMGDPARIGDYPEATDINDIVPTGLVQLIKEQFNAGVDKAGQSIDYPTNFMVGCALNLTAAEPERELKLLHKKVQSGADFALTQPVFDPVAANKFIKLYEERYGETIIPILAGVRPLFNHRNAQFLHNEVPGISIPDHLLERMRRADDPQQEGVKIAQEILQEVRPFVQGVYLQPGFGRYDLVADVLDVLREK